MWFAPQLTTLTLSFTIINKSRLKLHASPLSQMDRVHKTLIGPAFGLTSQLKRKASSCGVCRLRFNSDVGVVLWEIHALNCFSRRASLFSYTPLPDSWSWLRSPALVICLLSWWEELSNEMCTPIYDYVFVFNVLQDWLIIQALICAELTESLSERIAGKTKNTWTQKRATWNWCKHALQRGMCDLLVAGLYINTSVNQRGSDSGLDKLGSE